MSLYDERLHAADFAWCFGPHLCIAAEPPTSVDFAAFTDSRLALAAAFHAETVIRTATCRLAFMPMIMREAVAAWILPTA